MKVQIFGLLAALTLVACGGGGGGGDASQPQGQTVQASPTAKGFFTIKTVTAPTSVAVADPLVIQVSARFMGSITPEPSGASFTFPVVVSVDGTPAKTVNITMAKTVPAQYEGTVGVTMPVQLVGVHSYGVRLDPGASFTVDGTISGIEYVTTTVTP